MKSEWLNQQDFEALTLWLKQQEIDARDKDNEIRRLKRRKVNEQVL